MKPSSTLFLKVALVLIGLPILAFCLIWLPGLADIITDKSPGLFYLRYPFLIGVYLSAIAFFFALYQAYRLLSYIDTNQAFSALSVAALKNIKYCAITISAIYAAILPLFYLIAEKDDAPGVIVLGLVMSFAALVVAVFAAVLQKLLTDAIEIKSENDLTV